MYGNVESLKNLWLEELNILEWKPYGLEGDEWNLIKLNNNSDIQLNDNNYDASNR